MTVKSVKRQGVFPIVHTGVYSVVLLSVKLIFSLEISERTRYPSSRCSVIPSFRHQVRFKKQKERRENGRKEVYFFVKKKRIDQFCLFDCLSLSTSLHSSLLSSLYPETLLAHFPFQTFHSVVHSNVHSSLSFPFFFSILLSPFFFSQPNCSSRWSIWKDTQTGGTFSLFSVMTQLVSLLVTLFCDQRWYSSISTLILKAKRKHSHYYQSAEIECKKKKPSHIWTTKMSIDQTHDQPTQRC